MSDTNPQPDNGQAAPDLRYVPPIDRVTFKHVYEQVQLLELMIVRLCPANTHQRVQALTHLQGSVSWVQLAEQQQKKIDDGIARQAKPDPRARPGDQTGGGG
jgi:hypothetical protein